MIHDCTKLRRCAAWLGLAAALATGGAWAADAAQAPPPVEAFYRHADILEASLSPSGRHLAVMTGQGGDRVGLVVFDVQNLAAVKQAARFPDADIRDFQWVNDDHLVFRIIDLTAGGGDQRVAPGLFSVKSDGSELRQLVRIGRDFVTEHRIRREPLEWNHELLRVPQGGGNDVIVGRMVFNNIHDLVGRVPLLLDVTTQRIRPAAPGAPEHVSSWVFDPTGQARIAITAHEGQTRIHWRAPGDEGWKELARSSSLNMPFTPIFVDATGQLFVTAVDAASGYRVLKRFDFAAGRPETQALVSTPGFDFRGRIIASDGPSGRALGVRVETDAETTVWFDERLKRIQQAVDARFPGGVSRLTCRRCESDDMVALVNYWSDQEPGQYWVHQPARNSWQFIGRERPDIDPKRMATLDLHRIRARDGLELPVWVTLPPGTDPKKPRPAVVLVHGGPWVRGVHWHWDSDAQFLASRGYVVIEPEFRGSTGYGQTLFRAGWKQWGLSMQDDVADALTWAVGKGWVDAKRVCVAGASYGGYATLMGLVRHPDLYRCGIAWVAVTDPRMLFEPYWRNDISAEARLYQLPDLIGDPKNDAAALAAVAPVEQASRIKAPLMLAFGGDDTRVPLEHGARLRAAMRAAGQEPDWTVYPGEWHGWLRLETRYDFARRMERFLAKQLQ